MVARLHLDDPLQSFTNVELSFLKKLCNELPRKFSVRAQHDKDATLQVCFEYRYAFRVPFKQDEDEPAIAATVLKTLPSIRDALGNDSRAVTDPSSVLPAARHLGDRSCTKCGRVMVEVTDSKRRHGSYLCPWCAQGNWDPRTEAILEDARKRLGRFGRASGWR